MERSGYAAEAAKVEAFCSVNAALRPHAALYPTHLFHHCTDLQQCQNPPVPAYAFTIFIGAFLLFQIQPLIGKYILPWFGGGPSVWTTCMLFFQLALLAGYAYAHLMARWLKPSRQATVHLLLLLAAITLLPISPGEKWKPEAVANPTFHIFALLTATIGLPYFVLSGTAPLLQQWFGLTHPTVSPYRLYSLSNAGSLLALVSYPFFFETHFTRKSQAIGWGWGWVAYAMGCGFCALKLWKKETSQVRGSRVDRQEVGPLDPRPTLSTQLLWLLWPACGSVLLLATTNKISQDIAAVPFLWVLPLALYLLSFVICFENRRWYAPVPFTLALLAGVTAICWGLWKGSDVPVRLHLGAYSVGLFVCCMVCHGELYRLKPSTSFLTRFYLMIAAGGALGGLFVALAAPKLFTSYFEIHYGVLLCALLFALSRMREPAQLNGKQWRWLAGMLTVVIFIGLDFLVARLAGHSKPVAKPYLLALRISLWAFLLLVVISWIARKKFRAFPYWNLLACAWLWIGCLTLAAILWLQGRSSSPDIVYRSRNFYGVLTVYEHYKDQRTSHHLLLQHGRITHGLQFTDPQQATWPTTYYGEQSGVGLAVAALPSAPRRIGVVGLGTGTMAAYGRAGDYLRIYEINPEIQRLAVSCFTYLTNCRAKVQIVLGDARLSMEREPPQNFDLLALDAFSSDAIPVHLLTREAFAVYDRHLATNGIIAVHISNHYLDLEPVVMNLAHHFNYRLALIDYDELEDDWWLYSCTWVLLTRSNDILNQSAIRWATTPPNTNSVHVPIWTDDFASLFQVLK